MMQVRHAVKESPVHGLGLFATEPVKAGTVLWRYIAPQDYRLDAYSASAEQLHYGYINPRRPHELVNCGGKARFWNFAPAGTEPNSIEAHVDDSGEAVIIAAHDIAMGEEFLIDPATDADAGRKLNPFTAAPAA